MFQFPVFAPTDAVSSRWNGAVRPLVASKPSHGGASACLTEVIPLLSLGLMLAADLPEGRLGTLGIELPEPLPPFGQYVPAIVHGTQLWVGGHFGTHPDGSLMVGRCGEDVSVELARLAARSAALNLLSTVRSALGSLDEVRQVTQIFGVVNATPEFSDHTSVIDAASDLLVEVFGDAGRHTRLAVGVASLPANLVLEIQAHCIICPQGDRPT